MLTAAMAPLLELTDLRVMRGPTAILRGIDWRVARGEHWAILGANGSGKTTLLKALTGYMPPSSGAISLLGQQYGACDWRDLRLQIGVVTSAFAAAVPPAEPALDTVISGKYAQLDLWHAVTRSDRTAARRLLSMMELRYLAAREWAYLSQGERQRVLIARALIARPRLLILDEPCAGLDPVARENFLRFIETLAQAGTVGPAGTAGPAGTVGTVGGASRPDSRSRAGFSRRKATPAAFPTGASALVLVTHHVEEITPAFTHALLLREGEVVASGPRAAVLTSANLSATFGARLRLARNGGRYRLAFGDRTAR